jgi:LemA protein
MAFWAIVCVVVALLAFAAVTFNELVTARNQARTAWSGIDVQLQRRHDLIPQLAAVAKGYAHYEQATLNSVTELRTRAQASVSIAQRGQIEGELGAQASRLIALGERYPDLKANTNFMQLQQQLVDTENRLQESRQQYNEAVRAFNTEIETPPDLLLARPFGFGALEYFQAENKDAPKI